MFSVERVIDINPNGINASFITISIMLVVYHLIGNKGYTALIGILPFYYLVICINWNAKKDKNKRYITIGVD